MNRVYTRYQHSGRFNPAGLVLGTALGLGAGAALAFVYPYVTLYIPIVGYISFILSGGFGAMTGLATGQALRKFHVRNTGLGTATGLVVALASYYLSWAVWMFAFLHRQDVDANLLEIVTQPGALWELIGKVNEVGAWSIKGATPTGVALWVLWALEAVLVIGAAVLLAHVSLDTPYCETCRLWATEAERVSETASVDTAEVKRRLGLGDLAVLEGAGPRAPDAQMWLRLDVHSCARCNQLHTLSVIQLKLDKDGKSQNSTVVDKLWVTSADVERIRRLNASLAPELQPSTVPA